MDVAAANELKGGGGGSGSGSVRLEPLLKEALQHEHEQHAAASDAALGPLQSFRQQQRQRQTVEDDALGCVQVDRLEPMLELLSKAGRGTCIKLHSLLVAVGTSRGLTMLFDRKQRLVKQLHQPRAVENVQAVSALDISSKADFAAIGYISGHVVLWDISSMNVLKIVDDAHQAPITTIRFYKIDKPSVVSVDAKGIANIFHFFKFFLSWSVERHKMLDGSVGQVFDLVCALPNPSWPHSTDANALMAVAACTSVSVLATEPTPAVLGRIAAPSSPSSSSSSSSRATPCVAWRSLQAQDYGGSASIAPAIFRHPLLAIGWSFGVQLMAVLPSSSRPATAAAAVESGTTHKLLNLLGATSQTPTTQAALVRAVSTMRLENGEGVLGMAWFGYSFICVVSDRHRIYVLDPIKRTILQSLDVNIRLQHHTLFHQRHRQTEQQLMSYHSSLSSDGCSVLLLEVDTIRQLSFLSPSHRVTVLAHQQKWLPALALAIDIYESLPSSLSGRAADEFVTLLDLLLEPHRLNPLRVSLAMEFCVALQRVELLMARVLPAIRPTDLSSRKAFFSSLTRLVVSGAVKTLPLEVLQELIVQCPNSTCAETCLMSLDLSHIELGAIERFCVAHGLYGAFIAAYNVKLPTALSAPLDALLRLVEEDESVWDACSSVLLLYLSLSLRGRSFPAAAELPPAACVQARLQLLSRLFFEPRTGADAAARFLEAFANRFLDALASAFENGDWTTKDVEPPPSPPSQQQQRNSSLLSRVFTVPSTTETEREELPALDEQLTKQAVFDCLSDLVFEPSDTVVLHGIAVLKPRPRFDSRHVLEFSAFAARMIGGGLVLAPPSLLWSLSIYLVFSCCAPVSDAELASLRERAEHQLLHLFARCPPPSERLPELLKAAAFAQLHRVSLLVHECRREWTTALEFMLSTVELQSSVFGFVTRLLLSNSSAVLDDDERQTLSHALLSHLPTLVCIDDAATAALIVQHFPFHIDAVLHSLHDQPDLQFRYLDALMDPTLEELAQRSGAVFSAELHERYVELLCERDCGRVLEHIRAHDKYAIDRILLLCQRYKVADASAFLLERTGDVAAALQLILDSVDDQVNALKQALAHLQPQPQQPTPEQQHDPAKASAELADVSSEVALVASTLGFAASLCQRHSRVDVGRLGRRDLDSEQLWFTLLDKIVSLQRDLKRESLSAHFSKGSQRVLEAALLNFVQTVLNAMDGFVSISSLLLKIANEHADVQFVEFREAICGMMETCAFEERAMSLTAQLVLGDTNASSRRLVRALAAPARLDPHTCCSLCRSLLHSAALLFGCGHVFHESCATSTATEQQRCVLCESRNRPRQTPPLHPLQQRREEVPRPSQTPPVVSVYGVLRALEASEDVRHSQRDQYRLQLRPPSAQRAVTAIERKPGTLPPRPLHAAKLDPEVVAHIQ